MEDGRFMLGFEKSSQELLKESWELFWCVAGTITLFFLVCFGIYFSSIAISSLIGNTPEMKVFSYSVSIAISALEVAAVKIFGNKARAEIIKLVSSKEYRIVGIGTFLLFVFDVITNWSGLYLIAFLINKKLPLNFTQWVLIIMMGLVMAFSEIFVGFMLRATGTAYAGYIQARKKYDGYMKSPALSNLQMGDSQNPRRDEGRYEERNRQSLPGQQSRGQYENRRPQNTGTPPAIRATPLSGVGYPSQHKMRVPPDLLPSEES